MIVRAWIDSLKVHDVEASGMVYALRRVAGLAGTPAPKRDTRDRPRAHGATDSTRYWGPRVLTVEGYVRGADAAELHANADALEAALLLGGDHTLRFLRPGMAEDEQLSFRVAGELTIELAGRRRTAPWAVELLAPDPRIYSATLKTGTYDPSGAAAGAGLEFPLTFPVDFAGQPGASFLEVSNQGNVGTPPTFTITGPATNPIVDDLTAGVSIYTSGLSLLAGEQAIVDVASRRLTLGGVARLDLIDATLTTWFELQPGVTRLRLRGTGFAAGQTELAVAFRDARI